MGDPVRIPILWRDVQRPDPFFGTLDIKQLKRSLRRIRSGHAHVRPGMVVVGTVEIHDEFSGLAAEDHLGAFDALAAADGTCRIVRNSQRYAAVRPMLKIGGTVYVDSDPGKPAVPAGSFVFAIPVPDALVFEHGTAVGVDVDAVIVRPERTIFHSTPRLPIRSTGAVYRLCSPATSSRGPCKDRQD